MTCTRCQTVPTFPLEGLCLIYPASDMIYLGFLEALAGTTLNVVKEAGKLKFHYKEGDLPKLAYQLAEHLEVRALKASRMGCFLYESDLNGFDLITAYEWVERAKHPEFVELIQTKSFRHAIQPIVSTATGQAYGYECLLRPVPGGVPFSPYDLFHFSQQAGLQSALDSASRIGAIFSTANKIPAGTLRFINFLPSSIYDPRHCLKSTMQAANTHQVDPSDLVFEVVETEKIEDLPHLKRILSFYKKEGMKVALDDIGAGYSTIELLKDIHPDYAKLDRSLIQDCHVSAEKQSQLKEIMDLAKSLKIKVIAEGIELEDEYQICKALGADLAQGYYLGRPSEKLWDPSKSPTLQIS